MKKAPKSQPLANKHITLISGSSQHYGCDVMERHSLRKIRPVSLAQTVQKQAVLVTACHYIISLYIVNLHISLRGFVK